MVGSCLLCLRRPTLPILLLLLRNPPYHFGGPPIESVESCSIEAEEEEGEEEEVEAAMAIGSFGAIVLAKPFKLHLAVVRSLPPLSLSLSLPHCSPAAISNSISFSPSSPPPSFGRSARRCDVGRSVEPISASFLNARIRGFAPARLRQIARISSHNLADISVACADRLKESSAPRPSRSQGQSTSPPLKFYAFSAFVSVLGCTVGASEDRCDDGMTRT